LYTLTRILINFHIIHFIKSIRKKIPPFLKPHP
jgi:hypothetical protein